MTKLSYKVSYYVFYVCVALILVILGIFYGVGYDQLNDAGLVEPANTEALMLLMYGMFAVAVVATLIGAIVKFGGNLKDNPMSAVKSLLGLVFLIILLVVSYNLGSADMIQLGDGTEFTDVTMLKVSDMLIYAIYVLFGIATIGTLLNLTGIFKK